MARKATELAVELGFDGVPVKSMVLIQPTTHALVHLTEMPFTVITLDDVELVSLERVQVRSCRPPGRRQSAAVAVDRWSHSRGAVRAVVDECPPARSTATATLT